MLCGILDFAARRGPDRALDSEHKDLISEMDLTFVQLVQSPFDVRTKTKHGITLGITADGEHHAQGLRLSQVGLLQCLQKAGGTTEADHSRSGRMWHRVFPFVVPAGQKQQQQALIDGSSGFVADLSMTSLSP